MAKNAGFSNWERFRCSGVTVVPVHGEVDLATAPALRDRLLSTARCCGGHCLVVDMSGLDFFDASGVRVLVEVERELTRQGRHLALAEPSAVVDRVVRALDLERLFEIYPVVEMARSHAAGAPVQHAPCPGPAAPGTC